MAEGRERLHAALDAVSRAARQAVAPARVRALEDAEAIVRRAVGEHGWWDGDKSYVRVDPSVIPAGYVLVSRSTVESARWLAEACGCETCTAALAELDRVLGGGT